VTSILSAPLLNTMVQLHKHFLDEEVASSGQPQPSCFTPSRTVVQSTLLRTGGQPSRTTIQPASSEPATRALAAADLSAVPQPAPRGQYEDPLCIPPPARVELSAAPPSAPQRPVGHSAKAPDEGTTSRRCCGSRARRAPSSDEAPVPEESTPDPLDLAEVLLHYWNALDSAEVLLRYQPPVEAAPEICNRWYRDLAHFVAVSREGRDQS